MTVPMILYIGIMVAAAGFALYRTSQPYQFPPGPYEVEVHEGLLNDYDTAPTLKRVFPNRDEATQFAYSIPLEDADGRSIPRVVSIKPWKSK